VVRRIRAFWGAAFLCLVASCGGLSTGSNSPSASHDVPVEGVDTSSFTPRERHELSQFLSELPAPCPGASSTLGGCVEAKQCAECVPAAQAVAQAVREGMAREQVQDLYKQRFDPASARRIPLEGSPSRGPEVGPVVLVEFADFECPFCQKIAPELDALWEKHKDKVLFVYKFMPLSMHPHGELAARAAIAAQAQGKFWPMHHMLFANGQRLDQSDLEGYARAIGLDVDRFRADMQSQATTARIEADRKLADSLDVKGTPTIYIDGRPYDMKVDIEQWIQGEIAAKGAPKTQ
jgi:protein-disulfide isomerase